MEMPFEARLYTMNFAVGEPSVVSNRPIFRVSALKAGWSEGDVVKPSSMQEHRAAAKMKKKKRCFRNFIYY